MFLIALAVIGIAAGILAFSGMLGPTLSGAAFVAGFVWQKLGKWGPRILLGGLAMILLVTISLSMIIIGVTNSNPLESGIGTLISGVLFLISWTPLGFAWGLLGPKNFGLRMYPIAVRSATFWLIIVGLVAMTVPGILAEQMATATLLQKLVAITVVMLLALMLASYSWATNTSPTAGMKLGMTIVLLLAAVASVRFCATDWFDAYVSKLQSGITQNASSTFEDADKGKTVCRTFTAGTNRLYTADSIVNGKTLTLNFRSVKKDIPCGLRVQVLNNAKPIIYKGVAYVQITLPDSSDDYAAGETYLAPANRLSDGKIDVVPGQYAVTKTKSGPFGIGGKETRRIVFDADSIRVNDLPVGKNWILSGAAKGDVWRHHPKTGELVSFMFDFAYGECPASLEMIGKKGMVIYITFLS